MSVRSTQAYFSLREGPQNSIPVVPFVKRSTSWIVHSCLSSMVRVIVIPLTVADPSSFSKPIWVSGRLESEGHFRYQVVLEETRICGFLVASYSKRKPVEAKWPPTNSYVKKCRGGRRYCCVYWGVSNRT